MKKIKFKTSLAYDAICLCALDENLRGMFFPQQEKIAQLIESTEFGTFEWPGTSFSTLSEILHSYDTNSADWSLSKLKHFFETYDRKEIQGEAAKAVLNNLQILESLDFETFWREEIFPQEAECIKKMTTLVENYDISELFRRIGQMKNCEDIASVTVYISVMSNPISYSLSNNAIVYAVPTEYDTAGFLSLLSHELMHGFASDRLIQHYRNFMNSCRYLRSTHRSLIEEFYSGDEEEFVMAAEYYLVFKTGIMSKTEIISRNLNRYGGNVRFSLYLFELMHGKDIIDYNDYLCKSFDAEMFNAQEIIPTIDKMLTEYDGENKFYDSLFFWMGSCISVIREVQTDDIPDLADQIAAFINSKFMPNPEPKVKFIKTERIIESDTTTRKTLISENIKIEALTFATKQEAFHFGFPRNGANIGACPVEYEGETFNTPYVMNLTFPENEPLRAEFSFVCGNTRYLITAQCPDYVISYDQYGRDVIENYADEIITNVKKAAELILLLNNE